MVAAVLLLGAASLCGLDENQVASGYCTAGDDLRTSIVAIPALTVIVGYVTSVWTGRLTPGGDRIHLYGLQVGRAHRSDGRPASCQRQMLATGGLLC